MKKVNNLKTETYKGISINCIKNENGEVICFENNIPQTSKYVGQGMCKSSALDDIKDQIDSDLDKHIKNKRIKIINYFDSDEVKKLKIKKLKKWIENINKNSIVKIETTNYLWFSEKVSKYQNESIWNNLSNDRTSLKLFKYQPIDPSEMIAMVNIDFLIKHKGNEYDDFKTNIINDIVKSGNKFNSIPIFNIARGKVDEGNNRINKMYKMGFKTVPVYIMWK